MQDLAQRLYKFMVAQEGSIGAHVLGFYDTVIENTDAKLVVRRQTGYIKLEDLAWNFDTWGYMTKTRVVPDALLPASPYERTFIYLAEFTSSYEYGMNSSIPKQISLTRQGRVQYTGPSAVDEPTGFAQYKLKDSVVETISKIALV